MAAAAETTTRPRGPGFVYLALAMSSMLLIALIALTARQPPPPTIAEFAPQAVDQIKESPQEQSSRFGAGEGGEGGEGGVTTTTTTTLPPPDAPGAPPTTAPIERSRVRKCIGDPPRQIEDRQSPPCIAYWEGTDNGGSTWRGVTDKEIRIAVPDSTDEGHNIRYATFFNRRFEFYGRQLRLIKLEGAGFGGDQSPDTLRAHAVVADTQIDAFASLSYPDRNGVEFHYYDELAKRRILSVHGRPTHATLDRFADHSPYQWSYWPAADEALRALGDFVCSSLAGRPTAHAGAGLQGRPRKIGVMVQTAPDGTEPPVDAFKRAAARCDAEISYVHQSSDGNSSVAMLQMRETEATTVVCLCTQGRLATEYMATATSNGYFPEWVISTYLYHDIDTAGQIYPQEHREHVFGLTLRDKRVPPSDDPACWAIQEADPGEGCGSAPNVYGMYKQLLLLASGIQMAGPNLTPETFKAGLLKARFPNPTAGAPPYWQSPVGFSPNDHTMLTGDAAIIWFSPTEQSYESPNRGAWCYHDRGARFRPGSFPAEPTLFRPPCR